MIDLAKQKYKNQQHLSFHQGFAESLEPSAHSLKFNIATLFNVFDLLENKLEACKRIHECLHPNGEILVNVGPGKEPFDFQVVREMVAGISLMRWVPGFSMLEKLLQESYLTEKEYKVIFKESGFNIISFTNKTEKLVLKTKEELIAMKRPIVMSKPIMQSLPTKMSEWIFNSFIEKFLTKLEQNENGHYIYPVKEIVIHARKVDSKK
jgi:trans-aconitate methyltransferase